MPLYVENDEAASILSAHNLQPYAPDAWQLVQTHIIDADGTAAPLWRPGHNTGDDDEKNLVAALDRAIAERELKPTDEPTNYVNQRLTTVGEDGALLEVTIDIPKQANGPANHAVTVDWISLMSQDVQALFSAESLNQTTQASAELSRDILVHFRPPVDAASDPDAKAIERARIAQLETTLIERHHQLDRYKVAGALRLTRPSELTPLNKESTVWNDFSDVMVSVQGYADVSPNSRRILDLQLVTDAATFTPPSGHILRYRAAARFVGAGQRAPQIASLSENYP